MEMSLEWLQTKSVLTRTTQRTAILHFKTKQIKEDTLFVFFLFFLSPSFVLQTGLPSSRRRRHLNWINNICLDPRMFPEQTT